jgi:epoxide hydrolase 4
VLVIWGDADRFLDRRLGEASLDLCDRGEVVHLVRATHWVQHEQPEEVNRLLVRFLAGGPR